jgi:hypothetical protein
LLKGFQSQFYDTLRQSGLSGLVKEIKAHNLEASAPKPKAHSSSKEPMDENR